MADDFMTGYVAGQGENNCNNGNGFLNGDGWWAIILFAMIFGWGHGGYGFGGGYGGTSNEPGVQGLATRADVNDVVAFDGLQRSVSAIQQGICDSTYAINNSINSGFHGVDSSLCSGFNGVNTAISNLGFQMQDCCCQTQSAIKDVRYDMATQANATNNLIQSTTRDIIDGQNANTRAILDFLTQDKISTLQAENQSLKFQASQTAQNSYLAALSDAQTAELVRRIAPQPVPAYQVPAPYPYCGSVYSNCGCGC